MSNYIKMVDCSEEELMHYGVLGMKWHHHKATKNYNKMMQYKNSAQVKGQDAVRMIGQPGENRKQTRALLKGSEKDLAKANKYLQKHNKYVDKMNAGFDENRDKVMKSKKYTTLQKQINNAEDAKAAYKKSLDRGDYDEFEVNEKFVAAKTKAYEKQGVNHLDARQLAENDAMSFDASEGAGSWKPDMNRYNSDVAYQDKAIEKAQKAQKKMTDKVEKKRKKYVNFVY